MTSTIPTFSENNKFDGTNWLSWCRLVCTAAVSRGVFGYLDESITQPSTPPQTETPPTETLWDSEIPSFKECVTNFIRPITPQILARFPWSKIRQKALKKTF